MWIIKKLHPIVLIIIATSLQGQTHDLWFSGGIRLDALRDQGYSPLRYDGLGISGAIGYERTKDNKEVIWLLSYSHSNLSNHFGRSMSVSSVGLINLNFYPRKNQSITWGWANNNGFQNRFIQGFDNFNGRTDVFTSFGPASKIQKDFSFRSQKFSAFAISQIQLIGFYLPSGYVASLPSGFGYEPNNSLMGFWESLYLFYPGGAYNFGIWPALKWHLSTGNSISLNYIYEYTRLSGAQIHERSTGMWLLNFSMRLK
jgi:hypothetical protein